MTPKQFITIINIPIVKMMTMAMEKRGETTKIRVQRIPTDTIMELTLIDMKTQFLVLTGMIMEKLSIIIKKD